MANVTFEISNWNWQSLNTTLKQEQQNGKCHVICFSTAVSARNDCQAFCINQYVWWSHNRRLQTKFFSSESKWDKMVVHIILVSHTHTPTENRGLSYKQHMHSNIVVINSAYLF